jgi:hypothetical protein
VRPELRLGVRLELRPILSQVKAKAERRKAKTLKRFQKGKSLIPRISLNDSFGSASKNVFRTSLLTSWRTSFSRWNGNYTGDLPGVCFDNSGDPDTGSVRSPPTIIVLSDDEDISDDDEISDDDDDISDDEDTSDDEDKEEEQRGPSSSPSEPLGPYRPPDAKQ